MNLSHYLHSPAPETARAIPGALFNFLGKTAGANDFSLIHIEVQKGSEPPAHVHTREDENYYIIEGEVRFWIGDAVVDAKAGDFVHLPKNVPHSFQLLTPVVKEIMWLVPSGLEQWFWNNSAPAPDMMPLPASAGAPPPEVIEHFVSSLSDYGVHMCAMPQAETVSSNSELSTHS